LIDNKVVCSSGYIIVSV